MMYSSKNIAINFYESTLTIILPLYVAHEGNFCDGIKYSDLFIRKITETIFTYCFNFCHFFFYCGIGKFNGEDSQSMNILAKPIILFKFDSLSIQMHPNSIRVHCNDSFTCFIVAITSDRTAFFISKFFYDQKKKKFLVITLFGAFMEWKFILWILLFTTIVFYQYYM